MNNYIAFVHKDPNSSFGVTFPDLPGCYGAGDSYEEAIENAKVSLRLYAEAMKDDGNEMPQASKYDSLAGDSTVAIEMKAAAFVIEVPLLMVGTKRRVNVSFDDRILEVIDKCAEMAGVSRSAYLAALAMEKFQETFRVVMVGKKSRKMKVKRSSTVAI